MNQSHKIIALITFTMLGLGFLVTRHLNHQNEIAARNHRLENQALLNDSQRELAKSQDALNLITEIDRFKACNRNVDCENLYPRARKAIENAEADETRKLEMKSTYRE